MHLSSKHYITTFLRAENEHRQILSDLVSKTINKIGTHRHRYAKSSQFATETNIGALSTQPGYTNIDGGNSCGSGSGEVESTSTSTTTTTSSDRIFQICVCIERIFHNGLRIFKPDNTPDCWRFIEGLNWLNPQMTISIANQLIRSSIIHIPYSRIRNDKALAWIYECLETKTLSNKLRYLLSDREHLANCYEITAYLHSKRYVNALFICLNAIELEQQDLLSEIDQSLYEIRGEIGFVIGSGSGYTGIGSDEDDHSANTTSSGGANGGGGSADCGKNKNNNYNSNPNNSSHLNANSRGHKRSTSHPNFSGAISCLPVIEPKQSLKKMGNSKSLPFSYDDSPASSRRSSFGGEAGSPTGGTSTDELIPLTMSKKKKPLQPTAPPDEKGHLYATGSKYASSRELVSPQPGGHGVNGSNSSTRKHQQQSQQRKHSSRTRIKCKHLISQKLRPWTSLPDIRHSTSNKIKFKQITRSRSQTLRTDRARIRLTAENLAFKECYETPCKIENQPNHNDENQIHGPFKIQQC